ncbi:NADPH dehydrogenase NamA [Clostridia bacterium]|nr:NADPH dehydrogenase NamA [Clostridia bacterium]
MKKLNMFEPFQVKDLILKNRIVFPPMDLYCAKENGLVTDDHYLHYVSRAVGGTGLVIMEATAVMPNGRISDNCLGIWSDQQIEGLSRVVEGMHRHGGAAGIQINHAGRKCTANSKDSEYTIGPSPLAFDETYRTPRQVDITEIREVVESFKEAATRAERAGFDIIEIHGAHGYLISEFLSPLTNLREDEYGGSTENRTRFLMEVLSAVREVWPAEKPIFLRLSATDHIEGGMTVAEMVKIVNLVKDQVDVFHISSGGVVPAKIRLYPGYQVKLSEQIKKECQVPTIAVGLITELDSVEEILGNARADLVAIGRGLCRNPYWVMQQAFQKEQEYEYPSIYHEAFLDKLR